MRPRCTHAWIRGRAIIILKKNEWCEHMRTSVDTVSVCFGRAGAFPEMLDSATSSPPPVHVHSSKCFTQTPPGWYQGTLPQATWLELGRFVTLRRRSNRSSGWVPLVPTSFFWSSLFPGSLGLATTSELGVGAKAGIGPGGRILRRPSPEQGPRGCPGAREVETRSRSPGRASKGGHISAPQLCVPGN